MMLCPSAIPYKEELEPLLEKGISWVLREALGILRQIDIFEWTPEDTKMDELVVFG